MPHLISVFLYQKNTLTKCDIIRKGCGKITTLLVLVVHLTFSYLSLLIILRYSTTTNYRRRDGQRRRWHRRLFRLQLLLRRLEALIHHHRRRRSVRNPPPSLISYATNCWSKFSAGSLPNKSMAESAFLSGGLS
ncbi:hypothetical protein RHMOL_Rhmol01G0267600 [Rhododendron molle]|uniref:Uncharacterized protein n=1 Tax=Rhododendron molle TaxID=49168 RepID=A0ACC0Q652_RHOML|nr:hypothetical protein RHMOL_Rhmol01G0267600 [Rhododendron molle]